MRGRSSYKRTDCKHGHCLICGYDPKHSQERKTIKKKYLQFEIYPFLDFFINPDLFND